MSEENRELGKIGYTRLGKEEHGIFTFMIDFDFGGTGQGFGGFCLDEPRFKDTEKKGFEGRFGTAYGCDAIMRVLEAVGVEKWEDLVGKECWAYREDKRWNSSIVAIEAPAYRKHSGRFNIKEHFEKWGVEK